MNAEGLRRNLRSALGEAEEDKCFAEAERPRIVYKYCFRITDKQYMSKRQREIAEELDAELWIGSFEVDGETVKKEHWVSREAKEESKMTDGQFKAMLKRQMWDRVFYENLENPISRAIHLTPPSAEPTKHKVRLGNRTITDCGREGCTECTVCEYLDWLECASLAKPYGSVMNRDSELEQYIEKQYES